MVIFHSYVSLPEGILVKSMFYLLLKKTINDITKLHLDVKSSKIVLKQFRCSCFIGFESLILIYVNIPSKRTQFSDSQIGHS